MVRTSPVTATLGSVAIPGEPGSPLPTGKIPVVLLRDVLARLPSPPPEVRLGPRIGEDACALELPGGTLVTTTDPITLTSWDIGRFSVIINANDVAVMGVRPRWFLAVVLMPEGTTEATVRDVFATLQDGLSSIGAYLVGGHTEVTHAVTQPVVIGHMLGLAEDRRFVTTGGAGRGDVVLQVGLAPIEGAAVLSRTSSARLAGLDPAVIAAARAALDHPGISVVEPALLAAGLGATAMHDPTEGGLAAALHEMADASSLRIRIDLRAVLWFEPGRALCRILGADPLSTLASGALLATFPADRADAAVRALIASGHPAAPIGTAGSGSGVVDTDGRAIPWPQRDEVTRFLSPQRP